MGRQKFEENPIHEIVVDGETWKWKYQYQFNEYDQWDGKVPLWYKRIKGVIFISPLDGKERFVVNDAIASANGIRGSVRVADEYLIQYVRANRERLVRKKAKGERILTIGKEVWGWRVGKKNVLITSPSGKKTVVPLHVEKVVTADDINDTEGNQCIGDRVTVPSEITEFVSVEHYCEFGCCVEWVSKGNVVTPSTAKQYIERHRADLM